MTGTHSYTCCVRWLHCKLGIEKGGGGLCLSKMVCVWQNAHISKNRKEAEQKMINNNKELGFDFMAPKTLRYYLGIPRLVHLACSVSRELVFWILPLKQHSPRPALPYCVLGEGGMYSFWSTVITNAVYPILGGILPLPEGLWKQPPVRDRTMFIITKAITSYSN